MKRSDEGFSGMNDAIISKENGIAWEEMAMSDFGEVDLHRVVILELRMKICAMGLDI